MRFTQKALDEAAWSESEGRTSGYIRTHYAVLRSFGDGELYLVRRDMIGDGVASQEAVKIAGLYGVLRFESFEPDE